MMPWSVTLMPLRQCSTECHVKALQLVSRSDGWMIDAQQQTCVALVRRYLLTGRSIGTVMQQGWDTKGKERQKKEF